MNTEIFRKTLEFSKEFRKSIENSKPSQPNHPSSSQEMTKRAEPLIQALFRAKAKLNIQYKSNKTGHWL